MSAQASSHISDQASEHTPVCLLCGAESDHYAWPPEPGDPRRCRACGLVFVHPNGQSHDPVELYSRAYSGQEDGAGMDQFFLRLQVREDVIAAGVNMDRVLKSAQYEALKMIERSYPRGSAVLDIGAGPGYFVAALRKHGYQAAGLDVGEPAVAALRQDGYPAWLGPIETLPEGWIEPKVCTAFFMLHHVQDPVGFLRAVRTKFPQAMLIVGISDRLDTGRLWKGFADGALPRTFSWWGAKQLKLAMVKAGYQTTVRAVPAQARGDMMLPARNSLTLYTSLRKRFPNGARWLLGTYYWLLPALGVPGAWWARRRGLYNHILAVGVPANHETGPVENVVGQESPLEALKSAQRSPGITRSALYRWLSPPLVQLYRVVIKLRFVEMVLDYLLCKFFPNVGIPFLESTQATGDMEQDWDRRAKLNALLSATAQSDEGAVEAASTQGVETWLLQGVADEKSAVVLEIGCGIGALLKPLAQHVKEVHGVDISSEMLKLAQGRLEGYSNVHLHKTTGTLDMFPESYFDLVLSSGVFIHFPQKELVYTYFREAARVLKPGGIFRFHVDGRSYLKWRSQHAGTVHGVVFKPEEIKEHLEECGFHLQDVTGQNTLNMRITAVLAKRPLVAPATA